MKKPSGFAAMDPATKRIVQRMGVLASIKSPRRRRFTREEAKLAAKKRWRSTAGQEPIVAKSEKMGFLKGETK